MGALCAEGETVISGREQVFGDVITAAAAIEYLLHRPIILEFNLPSFRLKQRNSLNGRKRPGEGGDR